MKTTAAILRSITDVRPYTTSTPMTLEEVDLAAPRPGELLVEIMAAGVCHSDLSVVDGSRIRPLPMALGHEAVGRVLEIGSESGDVDGRFHPIKRDDHVVLSFVPSCGHCTECAIGRPALCLPGMTANGAGHLLHGPSAIKDATGANVHHHLGVSAFARHAVIARESAVVIPKDIPLETAALFGCAVLTGAGAVLSTASVRAGQTVAVFGLGGVGLAAVMGAAVANAAQIIAVDPIASKREVAMTIGATTALSPDDAVQKIKDLTSGGVDVAIEAAGVPSVLEAAFRATRRGGTTVATGLPHPSKMISLPALLFAGEGRSLIGSYMGSSNPQRDVPKYIELWRTKRLPVEAMRSAVMPLDQINHAFEALASGEAMRQILIPS